MSKAVRNAYFKRVGLEVKRKVERVRALREVKCEHGFVFKTNWYEPLMEYEEVLAQKLSLLRGDRSYGWSGGGSRGR